MATRRTPAQEELPVADDGAVGATRAELEARSSGNVGRVRVGLSGWTYSEWRGDFYPDGLPAKERLAYSSARFPVLEVNASFYRTLRATTYAGWRTNAAPGTQFAVKGPKFVTHIKRLVDIGDSLEIFFNSGVLGLGDALGPILWQLPPSLKFDAASVDAFLTSLPTERDGVRLRYALEPRHATWDDPDAEGLLREHGVAFVTSDLAGRYPMFEKATAELVYVRLHGHERLYYSGYSDDQLRQWAGKLRALAADGHDVQVYFDNSAAGRAPHDALRLQELLAS